MDLFVIIAIILLISLYVLVFMHKRKLYSCSSADGVDIENQVVFVFLLLSISSTFFDHYYNSCPSSLLDPCFRRFSQQFCPQKWTLQRP